ncbi:MAG: hypothetical protein P8074_05315 [Anaerolineales bacterium]
MNTRCAFSLATPGIFLSSLAVLIMVMGNGVTTTAYSAISAESSAGRKGAVNEHRLQHNLANLQAEIHAERAALMTLYYSTRGDNWLDNTGWGTDTPYCEWFGVTCNPEGQVIDLNLSQNRMDGSLPLEIGSLTSLQILDLSGNQLSGPIPSVLSHLNKLNELWLSSNPKLICWGTQAALDWALKLHTYTGPGLSNCTLIQDLLKYVYFPFCLLYMGILMSDLL